MQPAHHTVGGHGLIVLNEIHRSYFLLKIPLGERLEEISARIRKDTGPDNQESFYSCFYYFHLNLLKINVRETRLLHFIYHLK